MKPTAATSATVVFSDGACTENPGPGGWGAIVATPDGKVIELGGYEPETTNNKMELTAVEHALRHLAKTPGIIHIYTDSTYVINGITKWISTWREKGWKTANGKRVANVEFWKRLSALLADRNENGPVEFRFVRGHSGVPGNERADEIAVEFSRGRHPKLYSGTLLKYGVSI